MEHANFNHEHPHAHSHTSPTHPTVVLLPCVDAAQVKSLQANSLLEEAAQLRQSRIITKSLIAPLQPPQPPWIVACTTFPSKVEVEMGLICPFALALSGSLLLVRVAALQQEVSRYAVHRILSFHHHVTACQCAKCQCTAHRRRVSCSDYDRRGTSSCVVWGIDCSLHCVGVAVLLVYTACCSAVTQHIHSHLPYSQSQPLARICRLHRCFDRPCSPSSNAHVCPHGT